MTAEFSPSLDKVLDYVPPFELTKGQPAPIAANGGQSYMALARDGDAYKALEFIVIPHPRPLSSPDIDPMDAKRIALGALVSQHNLKE